jgi:glycosyltransferase involved in cell wall biosynthesis
MEFGINKLRIVWICHFFNQTIQKKLEIIEYEKEFAPWITLGIEEIKKRNDVELHVISPFYRILKSRSFSDHNIHYHCVKVGIPFMRTVWPKFFKFDLWSNYYLFNSKVKKLIKKIDPDLIDLQGAENAYYSSSILGIKKYPVIVTIQGFVSLFNYDHIGPETRKRIQIEIKIIRKLKYFGLEGDFAEKYIKTFNPGARIYRYHCPYARTNIKLDVSKEYDLVFFAGLAKLKGIEDLIKAVSIAKGEKNDITLCIIGRGPESYINYLKGLISELNLSSNVIFKGFIPTQKEMHKEVIKARISVLPTYNDRMPGTIVESMMLGVPVITYNVGGLQDLNKINETIVLVEVGNISKLAHEIIALLDNTDRQKELSEKAQKYALIEFDNANSVNKQFQAYYDVIKEYNKYAQQ